MTAGFFIFASILLLLIGSQLYWVNRLGAWSRWLIPSKRARTLIGVAALAALLLLFAYNLGWLGRRPSPTRMTLTDALLAAPFDWWAFSCLLAFVIVIIFWVLDRLVLLAGWSCRKLLAPSFARNGDPAPVWPARRRFLERTAMAASVVPFVASAYGL